MSTIDKRVVQMVFDNEQFEKNIAKSQKSLESIDKQLSTIGTDVKEDKLANAVTKGMNAAETIVSAKAEIFRGIMLKIGGEIGSFFTNTIAQAQRAINNLTFDQINVGFSKYEEKLSSVQTIMNATGKSIDVVEAKLQELNWYTDETSANFTDMTNNIGKFTSAGVELEDAAQAMMGISNWAYLSGANLNQAASAMYNFSQAMGTGVMMSQDWKSIENANMATREFKQTVIETAKELYREGKIQEDVIEKYGVTAENLRSTLNNKWFTSDIMMESTKAYGAYTQYIKEIQEAGEEAISADVREKFEQMFDRELDFDTASGVVRYLNFIEKNYTDELAKIVETYGAESEELKTFTNKLGISVDQAISMTKTTVTTTGETIQGYFYNISKKAFLAAQEYKTFADVINATTDAVSTKWMNVFQMIFGNYEEAKSVWTEMGDLFYEIFATPIDKLIEIVEVWTQFSGRKYLVGIAEDGEAVYSVFQLIERTLTKIAGEIKNAFLDVFPFLKSTEQLGQQLAVATYLLADWAKRLMPTQKVLDRIGASARGVFVILKGVGKVIYSILKSIKVIAKAILPSFDSILSLLGIVNEHADSVEGALESVALMIYRVANVAAVIINRLKQAILNGEIKQFIIDLGKFLLYFAVTTLVQFVSKVKDAFKGVESEFGSFTDVIAAIVGKIGSYIYGVATAIINGLGKAISDFMGSGVANSFLEFMSKIPASLGNILRHVFDIFKNILVIVENLLGAISGFLQQMNQNSTVNAGATIASIVGLLLIIIEAFLEGVKQGRADKMAKAYVELFDSIGEALKSFQHAVDSIAIRNIAMSLVLLAVSALMLANIPSQALARSLIILTGSLVALIGALAVISSMSASKVGSAGLAGILNAVQKLAVGMLILATIVIKFMKKDPDELGAAIGALAGLFMDLVLFIGILRIFTTSFKNTKESMYEKEMKAIVKIMQNVIWLAFAVALLSSSMSVLGRLDTKQFVQGIISISIVTGLVLSLMKSLKSFAVGDYGTNKHFYDNVTKIGLAVAAIAVVTGTMAASVIALSFVPTLLLVKGFTALNFIFKWVKKMFGQVEKLVSSISKNSLAVSGNGLFQIATSVMAICAAVNLLIIPIFAFGLLPLANLIQGVLAFGVVMGLLNIFFGMLKMILGGNKANSGSLTWIIQPGRTTKIESWANSIINVGAGLMMLSFGVAALTIPVYIFAKLAEEGHLWEAIGAVGTVFAGIIAFFFILKFAMHDFDKVGAKLGKYDSFLVKMGESLLLLSVALYILANVIQFIGEIDDTIFTNGAIRLLEIVGALLLCLAIVKICTFAVEKFAKNKESKKLTTIGKEIFMLGAGLFLLASSLSALIAPILLMTTFKEETFHKGFWRVVEVLALVAGFIAALMLIFGISNAIAGDRGIGDRTTTETNEKAEKGLFAKKNKKKVVKQMDGFGETIFKVGKALMLIAAAITLLLVPIAILGTMSVTQDRVYTNGLNGVLKIMGLITVMFIPLALLMKFADSASKMWAIVGVIAALGLIVFGFVEVAKGIGNWYVEIAKISHLAATEIEFVAIVGMLGSLIAIIGSLWAVFWLAKEAKGDEMLKVAGSLAIVAASIIGIAFALSLIGKAYHDYGTSMIAGAAVLAIFSVVVMGIILLIDHFAENAFESSVSFAIAMGSIGASFLLIGVSLLIVQSALEKLIKTAESSKEGWDAIYKGVGVFGSFVIISVIAVVILAVLGSLLKVLPLLVLAFALAIFLLAASFWLVIDALIKLSEKWDIIEDCLDKVTVWLSGHSDEWAIIVGKFFAGVFSTFITTLAEMAGEAGTWIGDIADGLKNGYSLFESVEKASEKMGARMYDKNSTWGWLFDDTNPMRYMNPFIFAVSSLVDSPDDLERKQKEQYRNAAIVSTRNAFGGRNPSVHYYDHNTPPSYDEITAGFKTYLKRMMLYDSSYKIMNDRELQEEFDAYLDLIKFDKYHKSDIFKNDDRQLSDVYKEIDGVVYTGTNGSILVTDNNSAYSMAQSAYDEYSFKNGQHYKDAYINNTVPGGSSQYYLDWLNAQNGATAAKEEETVTTMKLTKNLNSANNVIEDYNGVLITEEITGDNVEDVSAGAGMADDSIILAAQNGYGAQLANEQAIQRGAEEGTKQGTIDGIRAVISNAGGTFTDFLYTLFGKEKIDEWSEKLGAWTNEVGSAVGQGFTDLTGWTKEDVVVGAVSLLGIDTNSEEGKKLVETLTNADAGKTVSGLAKNLATDIKNGKLTREQFNKRLEEAGLGALNIDENSFFGQLIDATGINDIFEQFEQGDYSSILGDLDLGDMSTKIEEEINQAISDATGGLFDPETGGVNTQAVMDQYASNLNFNPDDIMQGFMNDNNPYGLGSEYGMDFANGQIDAYKEAIGAEGKNLFEASGTGSAYGNLMNSDAVKTVLRYQDGVLLEAAANVEALGLVAQIDPGNRKTERQLRKSRAMIDAANALAKSKQDTVVDNTWDPSRTLQWVHDKDSDFWYLCDMDGNPITQDGKMVTKEFYKKGSLEAQLIQDEYALAKTSALEKKNEEAWIQSLSRKDANGKDIYTLYHWKGQYGEDLYGRQIDKHQVVLTDKNGVPARFENGAIKMYDPTAKRYYEAGDNYHKQWTAAAKTMESTAQVVQNAQNSQPQTSAVNGQNQTNKASTGSTAYAKQVNQTSFQQQKSGAAQAQQTGTSSASAAQSAASATDYLRAINERANLMYNTLVTMDTRQNTIVEYLGLINDNTHAAATTPAPVTLTDAGKANLMKMVDLGLGMKAKLKQRGV